jgi:hypothetical protein
MHVGMRSIRAFAIAVQNVVVQEMVNSTIDGFTARKCSFAVIAVGERNV